MGFLCQITTKQSIDWSIFGIPLPNTTFYDFVTRKKLCNFLWFSWFLHFALFSEPIHWIIANLETYRREWFLQIIPFYQQKYNKITKLLSCLSNISSENRQFQQYPAFELIYFVFDFENVRRFVVQAFVDISSKTDATNLRNYQRNKNCDRFR